MKYISITTIAIFLIIYCCMEKSFSQTSYKAPDRMKMLNAFSGEWKGEMVNVINKKKIKYKITHTSSKVAGGWGFQLLEIAMIPEKGKYQACRIFSYSETGDTTYMYTVDNLGATWFYTGVWENNKKLVLHAAGETNGKKTGKHITYQFISPKEYEYKSVTTIEGSSEEIVEMKMFKN